VCTPRFGAAYTIFVNLTAASASTGQASDGGTIAGRSVRAFITPTNGDAVLYLRQG